MSGVLEDFLKGEVFASPIDAIVADGQRMVGQPVDFKTDTLPAMRIGETFTLGLDVGVDIIVRVDAPDKGTIVAVRQTPKPVAWDAAGNPTRWEPT